MLSRTRESQAVVRQFRVGTTATGGRIVWAPSMLSVRSFQMRIRESDREAPRRFRSCTPSFRLACVSRNRLLARPYPGTTSRSIVTIAFDRGIFTGTRRHSAVSPSFRPVSTFSISARVLPATSIKQLSAISNPTTHESRSFALHCLSGSPTARRRLSGAPIWAGSSSGPGRSTATTSRPPWISHDRRITSISARLKRRYSRNSSNPLFVRVSSAASGVLYLSRAKLGKQAATVVGAFPYCWERSCGVDCCCVRAQFRGWFRALLSRFSRDNDDEGKTL